MRKLLGLLSFAWVSAPLAAATLGEPTYLDRSREGWFWYQNPQTEEPLAPAAPQPTEGAAPPAMLSTAWLRANLERYRDRAIDDPTPRNIALYLHLQRVALDRAEAFADATQLAVQLDPTLDESSRRPSAGFAAQAGDAARSEATRKVMGGIARRAGIWFFFRSDCPYCHVQAPVLELLERMFGLEVQAISLDGDGLPDGSYPNFRVDRGQAQQLGVIGTPALFLVRPPNELLPISQGALALDQLVERVLTIARSAQWITDEEWSRTRAVRPLNAAGETRAIGPEADGPELLEYLSRTARHSTSMTPVALSNGETHR